MQCNEEYLIADLCCSNMCLLPAMKIIMITFTLAYYKACAHNDEDKGESKLRLCNMTIQNINIESYFKAKIFWEENNGQNLGNV